MRDVAPMNQERGLRTRGLKRLAFRPDWPDTERATNSRRPRPHADVADIVFVIRVHDHSAAALRRHP